VDETREFIGQGMAQLAAACFQGMPCSGSFSRSALLEHTGVRTRMGNVLFGLFMGAAILFFAPWFNHIPIASLAGLLLFIGFRLIDVKGVYRVWSTSRPDATVMVITFVVTVFVHLEYGIFAGIVASLVVFLHRARVLRLYELTPVGGPRFREVLYDGTEAHAPSELVALSVHGNLFFALSQLLRRQLCDVIEQQQPRFLILRMRRAHSIDYSCWNELLSVADLLEKRGGKLLVCEARPEVAAMFARGGMDRVLPPSQIFAYDQALYGALHRAAHAAYEELGPEASLSPAWRTFFTE
jgi:SulP family sulfate permease